MPTGYTADVQSGKITEFSDFAMACARAFGALITMRDEPRGAAIPDVFAPSAYNAKALDEATAKLSALEAMTEAERHEAADAAHAAAVKLWEDRATTKAEQRARYEAMLAKTKAWVPPTPDHQDMKKFMIDQLTQSIDFDCSDNEFDRRPAQPSLDDWYAAQLKTTNRDIAYHAKEQAKEIERARSRTKWVSDLRASLVPKNEAA